MRELAYSMARFSWAMSMFGIEQMTNLIAPRRAADAFGAVAGATAGELGPRLRSAFQTGDRLQRAVVEVSFGVVGLGPGARGGSAGPGAAGGASPVNAAASGSDLLSQVGNLGFELVQAGVDTVYWLTGTVWQQQQGVSGWGPVPPPPEPDVQR